MGPLGWEPGGWGRYGARGVHLETYASSLDSVCMDLKKVCRSLHPMNSHVERTLHLKLLEEHAIREVGNKC